MITFNKIKSIFYHIMYAMLICLHDHSAKPEHHNSCISKALTLCLEPDCNLKHSQARKPHCLCLDQTEMKSSSFSLLLISCICGSAHSSSQSKPEPAPNEDDTKDLSDESEDVLEYGGYDWLQEEQTGSDYSDVPLARREARTLPTSTWQEVKIHHLIRTYHLV